MKNQSVVVISLLSVGIGLVVGYGIWGGILNTQIDNVVSQKTTQAKETTGMHMMSDGTMMGDTTEDTSMPREMNHSMMMVTSERAFLNGMIPHHQEAVATAKEVIARGGSTVEIKKLAEAIVLAQEKEIVLMMQWYQNWYGQKYVDEGLYKTMMRDLSPLRGESLDLVFLEDMILHHRGAIMMAQSVQPYIEHSEMTNLTNAIIETQTEEITLMMKLSSEL